MAIKARTDDGRIESISIGVGSVAPTVIRVPETERLLSGAKLTPEAIEAARRAIAQEIAPITDLRSTEHYRRTVTGNVLVKFLRQVCR
jgi:xanthine dehydrogenase iron-sulfur cluster and FAD-binding subunit A